MRPHGSQSQQEVVWVRIHRLQHRQVDRLAGRLHPLTRLVVLSPCLLIQTLAANTYPVEPVPAPHDRIWAHRRGAANLFPLPLPQCAPISAVTPAERSRSPAPYKASCCVRRQTKGEMRRDHGIPSCPSYPKIHSRAWTKCAYNTTTARGGFATPSGQQWPAVYCNGTCLYLAGREMPQPWTLGTVPTACALHGHTLLTCTLREDGWCILPQ